MSEIKYTVAREFIYGLDWSWFVGDNEEIDVFDTEEEAQESLDDYIRDVNLAFELGNMDSPYDNDCRVIEIIVSNGYARHIEIDDHAKIYQDE